MGDHFNLHIAPGARAMVDDRTVSAPLQKVVAACVQGMSHCDMAGVSVITSDRFRTLAATSATLLVIDELQLQIREGPCFDSLPGEEIVTADDLGCDPRWPRWGATVSQQIGVNSSMSYRLFDTDGAWGVLNLYSRERAVFDRHDVAMGYIVARVAAELTSCLAREDGQQVSADH